MGQRFEFESGTLPTLSLRHLVPCPSPLHPMAEMRSDSITSLYDLGEIRRSPEGRYHCGECSRVEYEQAEAAVAISPEPDEDAPPTRNEALREALREAVKAAELATDAAELVDAEHSDRWPQVMVAYAALSQAWTALAREIREGE